MIFLVSSCRFSIDNDSIQYSSWFQKYYTRIFPFNRNLFTEVDFVPSYVTDRPNPNTLIETVNMNPLNPVDVPTETQDQQEIFQDYQIRSQ